MIFGVLLSCGLGVPIPEDVTLISAGLLAALKSVELPMVAVLCVVGVLAGDVMLFFFGRVFGYRVFKLPIFRSVFTESRIQIARQKVLRNSRFICFTTRFLPGLRAPIFLTAGIMGVRPAMFLLLDGAAALISVPIWLYVGWIFGSNLDTALGMAIRMQRYFVAGFLIMLALYLWYKAWLAKKEREILEQSEKLPIPSEVERE